MPAKKAEHTGTVAVRFLAEVDYLKKIHPDTLERIKIDASYVSQIRSGKRFPTVDHLVNLCHEFDYSGTWLLTGKGMKVAMPENKPIETRLSKIEEQLSNIASSLNINQNQGNKKGNNSRKTGTK